MNHESIIAQKMIKIPLSIYIHFPWCLNKCPYCDFNSYALSHDTNLSQYVSKLLLDIELEAAKNNGRELVSIYLGGGTPSLLVPNMVAEIIEEIKRHFTLAPNIEISLEANPGTIEVNKCREFKSAGINRFSVGVQSFNNEQLKKINRIHDAAQAMKAIEAVKLARFGNFNIDLMFGLPGQNVEAAYQDLKSALEFSPNHISWYQLTLENGISFADLPSDEEIWAIQEAGQNFLRQNGLRQYEVSAYSSAQDKMCKHNINYWQYGDYIGVGAGAHGKLTFDDYGVKRRVKISDPGKYVNSYDFIESEEIVDREKISLEFMLNALRLNQPISYNLFLERTGFTIDTVKEKLQSARELGLVELEKDFIATTIKGRNFLNNLLEIFL